LEKAERLIKENAFSGPLFFATPPPLKGEDKKTKKWGWLYYMYSQKNKLMKETRERILKYKDTTTTLRIRAQALGCDIAAEK